MDYPQNLHLQTPNISGQTNGLGQGLYEVDKEWLKSHNTSSHKRVCGVADTDTW